MEAASRGGRGDTNRIGAALKVSSRRFNFGGGLESRGRYSPVTILFIARCGRRRRRKKNKTITLVAGIRGHGRTWYTAVVGLARTALSGRVVDRMYIRGRKVIAILNVVELVHAGYTPPQGVGVFYPLCGPYGECVMGLTYLFGHALYSGATYMKASKGTILPHCAPLSSQLSILSVL